MSAGALGQRLAALEWAVAARARPGERESGDLHVVVATPGGVFLAVVDGLGHGPEAAAAARVAADALESHAGEAPDVALRRCHEALAQTRGVVATAASLRTVDETLTWLGVGNVDGILLRAEPGAGPPRTPVPLASGILGHKLPTLRSSVLSIRRGDVVVLASDGIRRSFELAIRKRESARAIAERILGEHHVKTDDALVLVARYLGNEE